MELTEEQDEGHGGVFDLVLEELVRFQDASKSKESYRFGFDRVLRQLMAEREKAAVEKAVAADRSRQQSELMAEREKAAVATALLKQQNELMAEREKAAVATALLKQQDEMALMLANQQNDFQLQLQKQQENFQAKLGQREERLQDRLEHERREHNLKQDKLLARQDELIARHDQERVEAKASQEMLLYKILDNQRNLPPRDENQEGVILEQNRQQTFFREVLQQLQEEVKTLRHSESGKSRVCQGRVILKQPDDANCFRSSFDSIHSRRT